MFAVPALQALITSEHEVVCVYSQPPRPAGRGKKLQKSAVQALAEENGVEVRHPETLKNEELPECDVAVVAAYGLLLPKHILEGPKFGCVNIHPSLLPRWRGAAPVQRSVLEGDKRSGVCIIQMDEGLDTGDILFKAEFDLEENITTGYLHDKTAMMGAMMALDVVDNIDIQVPVKQGEDGATYAKKIEKAEAKIDWTKSAEFVDRQIRGMNPIPAAYFEYEGEKYKVFAAEIVGGHGKPGEVIDDELIVACGGDAVRILELQKQGKKRVSAKDFLNGVGSLKGKVFN